MEEVEAKLSSGLSSIQVVLSSIVAIVGIIAVVMIVIKHLPNISDPQVKNEMWKSIIAALVVVAFAAIAVWLVPWIYGLF